MNSKLKIMAASIIAGLFVTPIVMAEVTPVDILKQCQSNAKEELVPVEEVQGYLRQCMEDAGIESADVENAIQELMPTPDNSDDAKPSTPEDLS